MFDTESDIVTILIITIVIIIIWRLCTSFIQTQSQIILVDEVIENKPESIESRIDSEYSTTNSSKVNLIKIPRSRIIRQPFPVGEPALPISSPTFLTQEDIDFKYGIHLPFSNPPPPNGPAFAGGYGPAEVPVPTGYMAQDKTIKKYFQRLWALKISYLDNLEHLKSREN